MAREPADDRLTQKPFAEAAEALQRRLRRDAARARKEALARGRPSKRRKEAADPPARRTLSDEALFAREMAGVRPLGRAELVSGRPAPRLPLPVDEDTEALAELADLVQGRSTFEIAESDEFIEGIAQGLDRRLLRRLRRGYFSVQGHIDLHGLTRVEARDAVARFVGESRTRRRRCVLIVHGRGLNSPDQIPVLKEALRGWLSRGAIGRAVLAFCTAQPQDGGAGAVYVLLRK